jgi:hypothetical protein
MSNFSNELTIFIPAIGGNGGVDIIPPSNPLNVMGSPMPTSVSLTWEQPVFNVNLTSYLARCIAMNGNSDVNQSTISTETNVTVEGLMPETLYTCHVISVADTIQGGSMSVQITTTTPMLMMPMNVTATATSPTMINVQWEHPPFMNTIDHYFVSWEPFGLPPAVTLVGGMMEINCVSANTPVLGTTNCTDVMEFNITGLEEYVNYTVMVIASNDVGNSTSGSDTAQTPPDVPGAAPGGLTAVMVTYNSMYVMWEALSFLDQNSPSVYYNLTYYVLGSMQGVATRMIQNRLNASISSLQSFTTYKVDVAAQNDIGTGPFASINVTTLAAPPGLVSNIVVTPNIEGTQANITWSTAQLFDANTVVVYTVLVRDVNGTVVLTGSTANLIIPVNGLMRYIRYTVTITASTEGGQGPPLSADFYSRQDVPLVTVSNIQADLNGDGLTVTWEALTDPNQARGNVSYMVCYSPVGETTRICETTNDTMITFAGVSTNNAYTVTVTPLNGAGTGPESPGIFIDRRTLTPTELTLIVTLSIVTPVGVGVVVAMLVILVSIKKTP